MSGMVERVAVALWHDRYPDLDWDQAPDVARESYRGHARAVIEAMREPTEGMIEAAYGSALDESENYEGAWRAMIDEALK